MNLRTLKSAESMWNSVGARWFLASHLSAADARRTENLEEKGGPVAAFGSRAYHVHSLVALAVAEQSQWLN